MEVRKLDGLKKKQLMSVLFIILSFMFFGICVFFVKLSIDISDPKNKFYALYMILGVLFAIVGMGFIMFFLINRERMKAQKTLYKSFDASINEYFEKDKTSNVQVDAYFKNPLSMANPSIFVLFGLNRKIPVYIQEAPIKSKGMIYEIYINEVEGMTIYRFDRFYEFKTKLNSIFPYEQIDIIALESFSEAGIYDSIFDTKYGRTLKKAFSIFIAALITFAIFFLGYEIFFNLFPQFDTVMGTIRVILALGIFLVSYKVLKSFDKDDTKTYCGNDLIHYGCITLRIDEYLRAVDNGRLAMMWIKCNEAFYCVYKQNHTPMMSKYRSYEIEDKNFDRFYLYELDSNKKPQCYQSIESFKEGLYKIYPEGEIEVIDIYGINER